MSLSESDLEFFDQKLNAIATEMVLAKPGSDEGLVPIYALLNEICGQAEASEILQESAGHLRDVLDRLLDLAQPLDQAALDYVGQFTAWGQSFISAYRKHESVAPFPAFAPPDEPQCEATAAPGGTLASAGGSLSEPDTAEFNRGLPEPGNPVGFVMDGDEEATPRPETETAVAAVATIARPGSSAEVPAFDARAEQARIAAEVDRLLEIDIAEDRELMAEFHTEAVDHLEQIEAALLVLENNPTESDSLASIFRSFHTIKGVAGFLHLVPINRLTHEVESLLDLARNGKLVLNSPMITVILKSKDVTSLLVGQISECLETGNQPEEVLPVSHLIVEVKRLAQEGLAIAEGQIAAPTETSIPVPLGISSETAATAGAGCASSPSEVGSRKAPGGPEPALASEARDRPVPDRTDSQSAGADPNAATQATVARGPTTIRVNTFKLDNLMDTVGELVITQSQIQESAREKFVEDSPMQRNMAQLSRITKDLQHTSMALRMIPVKQTFQRIGRLVRDLSNQFGKRVHFVTSGEETELDRNVVEQIGDPLVHMVRNALDHGLESNEERLRIGKEEMGTISLKAYHLGSNIVVELADDGRGLSREKLLAKAVKNGLVSEGQELTDAEVHNLIFAPGFSTAEKVTDVSGRGVGMDVVKKNIESLRGSVEIASKEGQGSTFKIKLPLTMAIIDGLVVRVGEDKFILPTTSVKVALRPAKEQISTIQGRTEILDLRGKTIPILRLNRRFGIEDAVENLCEGILVIVESMGVPFALLVDEMVSKQEVVIKNLGSVMARVEGIAGGAILGDGNIALILDPASLTQSARNAA